MREGPFNDEELHSGRGWLVNTTDIGPASGAPAPSLNSREALDGDRPYGTVARPAPRIIGCTAVGEDAVTGLPVTITAPTQLMLVWTDGFVNLPRLIDFKYPMPQADIDVWYRPCKTADDCIGAPAGGICACNRFKDCSRRMCQDTR